MDDPFSILIAWCRPIPKKAGHYGLYWKTLNESHAERWLRDIYNQEANRLESSMRDHAHYLFMAAVRWLSVHESDDVQRMNPHPVQLAKCALRKWSPTWFHGFCLSRWTEIWHMVRNRSVQISKLGRNALIAPLLGHVATITNSKIVFIDVGTSIGFGMLWPYLKFDYGSGQHLIGPFTSNHGSVLKCECNHSMLLRMGRILPEPTVTVGIEIEPISYSNYDDVLWCVSMIGPDDTEGFDNFESGLSLLADVRPEIVTGCVLNHLSAAIQRQSEDQVLVVNHAMLEHHLTLNGKLGEWRDLLTEISHSRPFFETGIEWISGESAERPKPVKVFLNHWKQGQNTTLIHGYADATAAGTQLKIVEIFT